MSIASLIGCVNWVDQRLPSGEGRVTDLMSGQIFNDVAGDSDADLRFKFFALTLGTIPAALIYRIPYRIVDIISCSWARVGFRRGEKEWAKFRITWIRENNEGAPDIWIRRKIIVISVLSELAQDVAKCVTYPLAAIALTFIAFFGLLCPLDGRKFYADIEDTWSLPQLYNRDNEIANYLAPCMQPKEVWDRRSLYHYEPNTITGTLLQLQNSLSNNKYLEDVDYHPLQWMPSVEKWRERYKVLKPTLGEPAKAAIMLLSKNIEGLIHGTAVIKTQWIKQKLSQQDTAQLEQGIATSASAFNMLSNQMNTILA